LPTYCCTLSWLVVRASPLNTLQAVLIGLDYAGLYIKCSLSLNDVPSGSTNRLQPKALWRNRAIAQTLTYSCMATSTKFVIEHRLKVELLQ